MSVGLPVSRLVQVSVNLSPVGAQGLNFDTLLILGDSDVIDVVQRIRLYNDIEEVAADFGTSAPEYAAALLFFGQTPQPNTLYIGKWAKTATAGRLYGGILTPTQQQMSNWTSIVNGGVDFTIDGVAHNLTGLNFSAATNLNGVATIIQAALPGGVSFTWNGEQFIVKSSTTGTSSSVAFCTAGAGTDISAQLMLTSTTAQEAPIAGIAAESLVTAVTELDNLTTNWYGLMTATQPGDVADSDRLAVAAYIEAAGNPHLYGITNGNSAALLSTDTTSIGYQLKQLGYRRTFYQWSLTPHAVASLFGRGCTVNFDMANSTITFMWKTEPGVVAELLTPSQASALDLNNWNYFVQFDNNTSIVVNGKNASGGYIDETWGLDWLANRIQTDVWNALATTPTKIPQTDAGNHLLGTVVESSCAAGVNNGLLAPGIWNSPGFGQYSQGDFLPKGYYVFVPPVATQSTSDRAARKSVPIQVMAKLAGAIHSVDVAVNVNR